MTEEAVKTFATAGTESYNLNPELADAKKSEINLTIDDENQAIVLDENLSKQVAASGNPITNFFAKANKYLLSKSGVKIKDKSDFFHLLSVMINAGIPMVRALKALVSQLDKNPKMQMIVEDMAARIEGGSSLSVAMRTHPDVFEDSELGMIQSGEASGQLSGVLDNLAVDTEKAYSIRAKIKSAMMYPLVVMFLLIAVVSGMMVYVVPKLTTLFESFGGDLPLVTKIVIGISDFLRTRGLLLLGAFGVFLIFMYFFRKTGQGKYVIDKFKLKIPIFGGLLKKGYLARFARSLSNLIDSNVTIVKTIEITANSIGNEVYKRRLLLAMEDIKQGIPLAENLSDSPLFPPMLVNMIDVGEQTAQLDTITAKVAKFYEDEVDTAVAGFSKILEPVILVIIGISVGTVVAAIMIPIMRLSNLSGI